MATKRNNRQPKVREILAGTTDFVLRPDYDTVVAELGEPPLGVPPECEFHWPDKPLTGKTAAPKGSFIYVGDAGSVKAPENVTVIEVSDGE